MMVVGVGSRGSAHNMNNVCNVICVQQSEPHTDTWGHCRRAVVEGREKRRPALPVCTVSRGECQSSPQGKHQSVTHTCWNNYSLPPWVGCQPQLSLRRLWRQLDGLCSTFRANRFFKLNHQYQPLGGNWVSAQARASRAPRAAPDELLLQPLALRLLPLARSPHRVHLLHQRLAPRTSPQPQQRNLLCAQFTAQKGRKPSI